MRVNGNVMGIDIACGSPLSRSHEPKYAVVILDSRGRRLYETVEAPLQRVIRLAWEYHVKRIGIDNVFELAPNTRKLASILSLLPTDVELYQVTLDQGKFVDIKRLATRIGIELHAKPRPLYTAYISALLALEGVGTPVRAVEYRTKIIVSRARSTGSGGSSAQRYARGMRTAILRVVREIKDALDNASLNYDLIFRRGRGGLDGAVFIVYAPRSLLEGVVKPFRGNDVCVVIRPEYRSVMLVDKIESKQRRFVVVGIDPGIETGLAIVDLSMRPLLVTSSRELDRSTILNTVYSYGIPVLVATDKNPPPDTAKKLASTLGVQLYVPPKSLSVSEKEQLIEWLQRRIRRSVRVSTTHERDALAAAIKALKSYERKFIEVERRIRELGIDVDLDDALLLVMKGHSVDEAIEYVISKYLEDLFEARDQPKNLVVRSEERDREYDSRIRSLEERIEELLREREYLKSEVERLRKEVDELSFQLRYRPHIELEKEVVRDRMYQELQERNRMLQARIQHLESALSDLAKRLKDALALLREVASGELTCVPYLRRLDASQLREVLELASIVGAVYVDELVADEEALKIVRERGVTVLSKSCSSDEQKLLWDRGIAIECSIEPKTVIEDLAFIPTNMLYEAIDRAKRALEAYLREIERRRRKELDLKTLLKMLEEYREEIRQSRERRELKTA